MSYPVQFVTALLILAFGAYLYHRSWTDPYDRPTRGILGATLIVVGISGIVTSL